MALLLLGRSHGLSQKRNVKREQSFALGSSRGTHMSLFEERYCEEERDDAHLYAWHGREMYRQKPNHIFTTKYHIIAAEKNSVAQLLVLGKPVCREEGAGAACRVRDRSPCGRSFFFQISSLGE